MARRALRPVGQSLWAACRSFRVLLRRSSFGYEGWKGGLKATESSAIHFKMPRAGARGASLPRYLSMIIRVAVVPSLEVTYTGESYPGARRRLPLWGSLQRRNFCSSHGPERTGGCRTMASPQDQCAYFFFRGGRYGLDLYARSQRGCLPACTGIQVVC